MPLRRNPNYRSDGEIASLGFERKQLGQDAEKFAWRVPRHLPARDNSCLRR
jgi:hypothetical protein